MYSFIYRHTMTNLTTVTVYSTSFLN